MTDIENFDFNIYKKSCWRCKLHRTSWGELRFIIYVTTGRKEWILCSLVPKFELGLRDPMIQEVKSSLKYYTFPTTERFRTELEAVMSGLYKQKISLL